MEGQNSLFCTQQTSYGSDDFYTPKVVFDTLGLEFEIDVASPPGGIPWIPAKRYFTMADDGLQQHWTGPVWMNPPFSNYTPWALKFIQHRNGIALSPFAKSKWLDLLFRSDAALVNLPSSLRFVGPNGDQMPIKFASVLWAFGDECKLALNKIGRTR
jgi:hypothetical protein